MKKILCLVLLAALLLTGCQGGVDKEQADDDVEAFFQAVSAGEYEVAKTFLHPSYTGDLQTLFTQNNIPDDVVITDIINFSWSWYDSSVGGSQYTREYMLTSGEITLHATVQIVRNDAGYGIYSLNIEPADT